MRHEEYTQWVTSERGFSSSLWGSCFFHLALLVGVGWHMAVTPPLLPVALPTIIEAVLIEPASVRTPQPPTVTKASPASKLGILAQAATPQRLSQAKPSTVVKPAMPLTVKTFQVPPPAEVTPSIPLETLSDVLALRKSMIPITAQARPLASDAKATISPDLKEPALPVISSTKPTISPDLKEPASPIPPSPPLQPQTRTQSAHTEMPTVRASPTRKPTEPQPAADAASTQPKEATQIASATQASLAGTHSHDEGKAAQVSHEKDPLWDTERLQQHMQTAMAAEEGQRQHQQREEDRLLAIYRAKILSAISHNWLIPHGVSKEATAQFDVELALDGRVLSVELAHSSGYEALDRSASLAIRKASPLPVPASLEAFDRFRHLRLTVRPDQVMVN